MSLKEELSESGSLTPLPGPRRRCVTQSISNSISFTEELSETVSLLQQQRISPGPRPRGYSESQSGSIPITVGQIL
jgi:hypothetical protein